ncbi:MAG TPA: flagellar hook-associated protein FlgL [Polyangiaceae bacterium]|nr:flagellar hook-associated protein FlgL [Polyangiaceae bacterium]
MRVSSTQYHATMNTALQNANARLETLLQKLASGQKYQLPSENPIASIRMSRLSREEAALDQYRENISVLSDRLTRNERYLDGMSADVLSARDLMIWAADGSNTSADVNAMASSLQPLMDSLFYSANIQDAEGRYEFSGSATATPTVTFDPAAPVGSRYTYTGNTDKQLVVVDNGVTQPANVTLDEIAGLLNQLDSVREVLTTPNVNVNDAAVRAVVKATITGIDAALESLSSKIATLGGAQNILATIDNNHANVSLSNKQAALILGQLDYADAAVKVNGYTTAVQATQKAYGAVSKLSLFDVL